MVVERQLGIKMRQIDKYRLEEQITVIEDVIKTHPHTTVTTTTTLSGLLSPVISPQFLEIIILLCSVFFSWS